MIDVDAGPPPAVAWYNSPTIRGLTGYAATLILTALSHSPIGKGVIEAAGLNASVIQGVLDSLVGVGGLALTTWLAKKRVDAGNQPTPPAKVVGTATEVKRLTGDVPIVKIVP